MGIFDFLRPRKGQKAEFLQNPELRGVMDGMDVEYLQRQVASLRIVGREDDAQTAVKEFLIKYVGNQNDSGTSRFDLARISYFLAYRTLPDLVYSRWSEFCDLWSGVIPFPVFLAIKGASQQGKRLTLDQIQEFKYYQGDLNSMNQYFLIEFPAPPDRSVGPNIRELRAANATGKNPSADVTPVLGPFFAAVISNPSKDEKHLYILGQSPSGGTTLRSVYASGVNARCGQGPEPTASNFLQAVEADLRRY